MAVELRRAMLVALGLAGCFTRTLGPDEGGGDDGESSGEDTGGSASASTTEPSTASATTASSTTTDATTTSSDTGAPTCEVDLEQWGQLLVCMPSNGGECIPCDDDPICRAAAENANGGCWPQFQYSLCGPELVADQCCSVVYVEDLGCIGRPFIVDGEHRSATACARDDWRAGVRPACASLDATARAALGEAWLSAALAEHASVASFARFVLDLLALGAPADLVAAAQRAMGDEIVHARIAFGLASAYLDRDVGPGPLASNGAMATDRDVASIVRAAIVEGCVGETVSAARAELALAQSTDPAVRRALTTIAADERRHAQLAWQFVGWAVRRDPGLRTTVCDAFARVLDGFDPHHAVDDGAAAVGASLREHGLLTAQESSEVTHTVAKDVIAPCAQALLHDLDAAAA